MTLKLAAVAVAVFIVGCSKLSSVKVARSYDPAFFTSGGTELVPPSDKLSSSCASDADFDACIVYKNPVAQKQASAGPGELTALLHYGVKLRGLNHSDGLENRYFKILSLHTPHFSLSHPDQRKGGYSESQSYVEQVTAYYWANRTFEYLTARLGEERLPVKGLTIYPDDGFTGFSASGHSISLAKKPGEVSKALSGEIVVQLLGQALAYQLSGEKSFDLHNLVQHKTCDLNPKGCCSSELGCAGALNGAFGDYLAGIMFPESPKLGETAGQSVAGQNICGLDRDLAKLSVKSRSAIYAACTGASAGKIALEGAWYASLWWKFRTRAEELESGASRDADILFFEHARAWTATSTFIEAKKASLAQAATYKGGKYAALLESVFTAAGL